MSTRANNRSGDRSWTAHSTNHNKRIIPSIHHTVLDQITEITTTPVVRTTKIDKVSRETTLGVKDTPRYDQRNQHYQYRYDNSQDRKRFDNKRRPNKYQHHRNQHKAQIIFEFSDQNMMEMMQTVRGFINLIKANPTTRDHYKTNKLANRKYDNEVNESEIKTSNLDQVQQFFNEDTDVVFNALVAADYMDEIDCTDGTRQPSA